MKKSNHFDEFGNVKMVNISNKPITQRKAIAQGRIFLSEEAINSIKDGHNKKGDVLTIAQVAGIQAAKNTSLLVPLSHPLLIKSINITFHINSSNITCTSEVICDGKTGVEIEAICATQVALLTIYDMCKYIDKAMVLNDIKLILKEGGKSGTYKVMK